MKLSKKFLVTLVCLLPLLAFAANAPRGPVRPHSGSLDLANPEVVNWVHETGSALMNVTNRGFFGNAGPQQTDRMRYPCPPENWAPQLQFPRDTDQQYLYQAALWIGAEIETEDGWVPRVSVGTDGWFNPNINELFPDDVPSAIIEHRTRVSGEAGRCGEYTYDTNARADFETTVIYTDTLSENFYVEDDPVDGNHQPLGLEIKQTTLSWLSVDFANFYIIEYAVENIGDNHLRNLYLGMYVDGDCGPASQQYHHIDDMTGFLRFDPETGDTVNIAWLADNDGFPPQGGDEMDIPHSMGMIKLDESQPAIRESYNWWISNGDIDLDFGPSWRSYADDDSANGILSWTRLFGTPVGDRHKYVIMRNAEYDFDQYLVDDLTTIGIPPQESYDALCDQFLAEPWSTSDPSDQAGDLSDGFDTRFLMSWGPIGDFLETDSNGCAIYDFPPGATTEFTIAILLGPDFHDPDNPQPNPSDIDPSLYDFAGLVASANAAKYIYERDYLNIITSPRNFRPYEISFDNAVSLFWDTPGAGDLAGYRLFGINLAVPEDTILLQEPPLQATEFFLTGMTNGDDWNLLLQAYDEDGYRSNSADTLVRIGAVNPVTNFELEQVNGTIELNWDAPIDPTLMGYTVLRTSEFDTVETFVTSTFFADANTVSGRIYDYTVFAESNREIRSLPSPTLRAIAFHPQEQILLIEEVYPYSPINDLLGGVSADSIHAAYESILSMAGYGYDHIIQIEDQVPEYDLEQLSAYDVIIWHGETNGHIIQYDIAAAREAYFADYANSGGKLIRVGRRIINNNLAVNPGYGLPDGYLHPLCIDSVHAFPRIRLNGDDHIRFDGASSLDQRFPDMDLDYSRVDRLRLGNDSLGYVSGIEPIWPCGRTWPLYTIEVQDGDTSGYEGEPCGVISENVILLTFPLYFVEHQNAVDFMQAAIEGLRENTFTIDLPEPYIPRTVALHQNYPNPFNAETTIRFDLISSERVTLEVFDLIGRQVTTLIDRPLNTGTHAVHFTGDNLASGIYFYRLQAGNELLTRKMVLLK